MHITHVPKECIRHILCFLDPPDHHSLLLTCRVLFLKVVPGLYRSPFQAILAFDGWHIDSKKPSSPSSPSYPSHLREATSISTSVVATKRNPSLLTSSTTTSSLSSSPSTSPSTSPSLSSSSTSFHNSVHTSTNTPPKVDVPHVKTQYTPHNVNIASSYNNNNNNNSNNIDIPPRRSSSFHHRSYSESHTIPHSISATTINPVDDISHCANNNASPLDRLKWSKMARLLQLLIACTDVQARLPALRYPGYGQQWIRPPCKVDYLRHYIDHHNFAALVLCFPYLFADKSSSCELLSTSPCTVPQDSDVFTVLFQIQRAFMVHTACRIQTLSVSARSMAGLVVPMIPQLSRVTRLELTDLDQDFELEPILDFVKSHRMLVGPILKDIKLAGRSFTSRDTLVSTYTKNSRLNADKVRTILGAIRELEKVDGQAWTPSVGLLGFKDVTYSNLKVLKCSFAPAPSSLRSSYFPLPQGAHIDTNSDWSSLLEKCRSLEQIKIPVRHGDVYRWAYLEKKTAMICAPILPTHRTKQLPPMHRIHLCGATVELLDTVADVAFAFQDTLQDLEAHAWLRVWQPATLEFDWTMARLTRLVLDGELSLHFCLDSLAWCPMLEHLSLSTHPSLDPGSHLLLYIRSREMHKVACLKRLRRLVLRGAWPVSDVALRKIADRCKRLTSLVLDHTTETSIGGVLLAVERMYMLESLSLRLDVVDLNLVRVVVRKLVFLRSMQLTSLYKQAL